jgi:uncharacterized RDD family membrane protein YckC
VLEDRITVRTPEGLDLQLTLAGAGSRMAAAVVDAGVQMVVLVAVGLVLTGLGANLSEDAALLAAGVISLTVMLILIGYHVMFELFNGGRTPGKSALGIRVVLDTGSPITFSASMIRNLVRIVDFLPAFYGVGLVSLLSTRHNQRVGDLAARTVVVRERFAATTPPVPTPPVPHDGPAWDVSAVSHDEVALIRRFVARRDGLPPDRREELAGRIARGIRGKVGGVEGALTDEDFLARVLAQKVDREV